jgi:hypothetical protein
MRSIYSHDSSTNMKNGYIRPLNNIENVRFVYAYVCLISKLI